MAETKVEEIGLMAEKKSEDALAVLKKAGWIISFDLYPHMSLQDSVGRDAWCSYKYDGNKQGKFAFQVLSARSKAKRHLRKHCGVPYVTITRKDNISDTLYKIILFLYAHNALNEEKVRGLVEGMSMLCPFKCGK